MTPSTFDACLRQAYLCSPRQGNWLLDAVVAHALANSDMLVSGNLGIGFTSCQGRKFSGRRCFEEMKVTPLL